MRELAPAPSESGETTDQAEFGATPTLQPLDRSTVAPVSRSKLSARVVLVSDDGNETKEVTVPDIEPSEFIGWLFRNHQDLNGVDDPQDVEEIEVVCPSVVGSPVRFFTRQSAFKDWKTFMSECGRLWTRPSSDDLCFEVRAVLSLGASFQVKYFTKRA